MLTLILAAVGAAQENCTSGGSGTLGPPSFTLSVDASDPNKPADCNPADTQPGYTCTQHVDVNDWTWPGLGCSPGTYCEIQFCFTDAVNGSGTPVCSEWKNYLQAMVNLGSSATDGTYTVYSQYRLYQNGNHTYSQWASCQITLINTPPLVSLNSPAGLYDYTTNPPTLLQQQMINGGAAQAITYGAASTGAGTASGAATACGPSCTPATGGVSPQNPFLWDWAIPGAGYNYIVVTATDEAGNQAAAGTPPAGTSPFALFNTAGGTQSVDCGSLGTTACVVLADGSGASPGIVGDPPSASPSGVSAIFTGYADPSIRADTVANASASPPNPYGTNLWMSYSWALLHANSASSIGYVPSVEIHLAYSPTGSTGNLPGGQNWNAYCSGGCSGYTPLYPSMMYTSSQGVQYYSSHEVSNIASLPNYPSSGHTRWFSASLMYFVSVNNPSIPVSLSNGCFVLSYAQDSPGALAWTGPASSQPYWCTTIPGSPPPTVPPGSTIITYDQLTGYATLSSGYCASWGQPALMVTSAFSSAQTAYLAAECFPNNTSISPTYYVFSTTDLTLSSGWTAYLGPFDYTALTGLLGFPTYPLQINAITGFDWAMRPDGTVVAVITPQNLTLAGPVQFGCLAVNFNMLAGLGNNPLTSIVASVQDMDASGTYSESTYGTGTCTYEPTSNTGISVVRHLHNTAAPSQDQYSIVDGAVFP